MRILEILVRWIVIPFALPLLALNGIYALIEGSNSINSWPYHPEALAVNTKDSINSSHLTKENLRDKLHTIELEGKRIFGAEHTWKIENYELGGNYGSEELMRWEALKVLRELEETQGQKVDVEEFRADYRSIRKEFSRIQAFLDNSSEYLKAMAREIPDTEESSRVFGVGAKAPPKSKVKMDSVIAAEELEGEIRRQVDMAALNIGERFVSNWGKQFPPKESAAMQSKAWVIGGVTAIWAFIYIFMRERRRRLGISSTRLNV